MIVSCDDDKICIPPTFKGFLYSPNPAHVGDIVTITAYQQNRGENVYGPTYTWEVSLDTIDGLTGIAAKCVYQSSVKASISDPDPSIKVAIPDNAVPGGVVSCKFKAVYNNAVDAVPGIQYESPTQEGYLGRFFPSAITATLFSEASGQLDFRLAND